MSLEIRGEGLTIRGEFPSLLDEGLYVGRGGWQGWQGLPARRREAMVRALSDGEHDVPVRLPARVMTIDPGTVAAQSEFSLQRLCDRVNGWGATGRRFTLTVQHSGETRTATVRVIAAAASDLQQTADGMRLGEFSAQLVAPDPRQYSPTVQEFPTVGGSVLVPSRGNFPAHPVIEIPSAPSAYTVSSPGGVFTVTGATAGGTHRIDLMTGRVTRNGVWMKNVGRGQLWAVPDGTQWEHTLSAPGRVLIRDTYV